MSTDVGAIVGSLRLDGTQFREEIAAAIAELKALSGQSVDIKVKDDALKSLPGAARTAASSLDVLRRAERDIEDATGRVGAAQQRLTELQQSGSAKTSQLMNAQMALTRARRAEQDAIMATYAGNIALADAEGKAAQEADKNRQSVGLLVSAIALLGPAIVPIAVGTAGLAIGFGGMATAGIAAFAGIKREMQNGTTVGLTYRQGLNQLNTGLQGIEATAARNILGTFQTSVREITAKMPALNTEVGQLATITGKAAGAVVNGLLNAFVTLAPYLETAATDILTLVQRLAPLGQSNGLKVFAQVAVSELPQVIDFVGQLVVLAMKLTGALMPFGSVILTALQMFVGVLNNMPVGMLTVLAQLALSVFAGFKTWEAITGIVEGVVATLKAMNSTLELSEGVLSNLSMAASVIGIALAAFTLILAHNAQAAEEAKAKQEAYAEAVRASNGAIDDGVRAVAAKALEEEGALKSAEMLGLSLTQVTSAALGQKNALDQVIPALDAMIHAGTKTTYSTYGSTTSMNANAVAATKLKASILDQNDALSAQVRQQKAVDEASKVTTAVMTDEEKKTAALAASFHMSTAAYQAATKAQKDNAASLAATTAKMQLENDAAGLLKQALDALNGKAISAAQAQQQFDQSLVSMTHAQNAAGKNVQVTTHNINSQTAAAVQVRGSLLQQVTALQNVVEANGGLSRSTGAARAQMMSMRDQIIRNAVAHGVDRAAVTAYIDKLLKIPRSVPPTKLDVNDAAALAGISAVKGGLASIPRNISIALNVRANNVRAAIASVKGNRYGGIEHFREGGIRETPFQSFADGKLPSQAMIAPDGANLVQWAETGTGGEAFIPLGSSNHTRSVSIWEETGRRLGVQQQAPAGPVTLSAESVAAVAAAVQRGTEAGAARGTAAGMSAVASQVRVQDRLRNGVTRS